VLTGFGDRDAFGAPLLQLKKKAGQGGGSTPGGVGAAQKYGTRIVMSEAGLIVALEAQSSVARTVNTRMVLYADQGGLPGALLAQSAVKTSVIVGANTYALLLPHAAAAGTPLWAALHSDGNFNWFLSAGAASRYNADAFADGPSDPFGASTPQANKAPVFLVFLQAATINLDLRGAAAANRFGAPGLPGPAQAMQLAGVAADDRFGAPALRPASATLMLQGFAGGDTFGVMTSIVNVAPLLLPGFANGNRVGAPTFAGTRMASDPELTLKSRHKRVRELSNPIGSLRRLASRHARAMTLENAE
jgi:hypothetical protein